MTFDPTITLGDVFYIAALIFALGMGWMRVRFIEQQVGELRKDNSRMQEVLITLTGQLQRVIGAFDLHVRVSRDEES